MINYDRQLAKKLITNLKMHSYDNLLNTQKYNIPQLFDLNITEVTSGEYKYLEKTYSTEELLLKVNNIYDIKRGSFRKPFDGLLSDLINSGDINPFLLFIDDEVIDPKKIRVISDDRYMYLEIPNFYKYDFYIGLENTSTPVASIENIRIPKVPMEFNDGLILEIKSSGNNITGINLNNNSLSFSYTNNIININITENLFNTDSEYSESNLLKIYSVNSEIYYIKIKSIYNRRREFSNIRTLLFNMNVEYSNEYTDNTIFIMHNGMVYTNEEYEMMPLIINNVSFINNIREHIYYAEGPASIMEDPFPEFDGHRFWKENYLVFKDNYLLNPNDVVKIFNDMGDLQPFEDSYIFKLFHNTKTWDSIDNAYKLSRYNLDKFSTRKIYADKIFEIFNMVQDTSLNYEENMEKLFSDVFNYNSELLDDYFNNHIKNKIISYSGSEIKEIGVLREDGYYEINVSKDIKESLNNKAIIYFNGLLYTPAYINEYAEHFTIIFDSSELNDTDVVDIEFFLNIFNKTIDIRIDEPGIIRGDGCTINKSDRIFYSITPKYHDFNLNDNICRQYKVDYNIIDEDNNMISYELDPFYYGKQIKMVSSRQFRRMQFTPVDYDANIHYIYLDNEFLYCKNPDHYLVYVNGRRLDVIHNTYIPTREDLPIPKHYLLLEYKLNVGDTVDVFYLPEPISETYIPHLPDNNLIVFDNRDILGFPITSKSVSLFINGKRISEKWFKKLSSIGFAVTYDIQTLDNVTLIKNIDYRDDVFDLYCDATDIWCLYNRRLPYDSLKLLHGIEDTIITDIEPNMKNSMFSEKQIQYEVLSKHWLEDIDVLDTSHFYNYALVEHSLEKFINRPQIASNDIIIHGLDGAEYANLNVIEFTPFESSEDITGITKTNDIGKINIIYKELFTLVSNDAFSSGIYVWLDIPNDAEEDTIKIVGFNNTKTSMYDITTLHDSDGNTLLKDIPQKRWIRLHSKREEIPNNTINYINLMISLSSINSKIYFTHGRLDRSVLSLSDTQVIEIDASVTAINPMPRQELI